MVTGQHAQLVPLERRHLEATLQWANDAELMRLLDRPAHVTASEHEQWFQRLESRSDEKHFAIEARDGEAHLGNAWLRRIDARHRKAELSLLLGAPAARGRGIGPEAIDLLARHAFDELGLHRVYAHVLAINPAARRAFEKAGFRLEGTLRADRLSGTDYVDVFVLGRLS